MAKRLVRSNIAARAMFELDRRLGRLRGASKTRQLFAIGFLAGDDALRLGPVPHIRNPVVTALMVSDIDAAFVADPFLLRHASRWYLFFEVWNNHSHRGEIAYCESADGFDWRYVGVVLREPFHLSYPLVFHADGEIWMIPETHVTGEVRLYQATDFPRCWTCRSILLRGIYCDATVFHHDGLWWMMAMRGSSPAGGQLELLWSPQLAHGWRPHPCSPLPLDPASSRPAGRVCDIGGRLVRFSQNGTPWYGSSVSAFEIRHLTVDEYEETPLDSSPLLRGSGVGWNRDGMHHIDLLQMDSGTWLAAVDGWCGCDGVDWSAPEANVNKREL